jgi:hypothetical protein
MISRRYFYAWSTGAQSGSGTFWIKSWLPKPATFIHKTAVKFVKQDAGTHAQSASLVGLNRL